MTKEHYNPQKLKVIGQNLGGYFSNNQGIILGNTAVVSKKVHKESPDKPGVIGIYRREDAGRNYLNMEELDKVVHIDILHKPAEINHLDVANRIRQVIPGFLNVIDLNQNLTQEEQDFASSNLTRKIHLYTGLGHGTALNPDQKSVRGTDDRYVNHVHLLAKLRPRYYGLVYCIIDQVERAIMHQGGELRPVVRINHYGDMSNVPMETQNSIYLPSFTNAMSSNLKRQNMFQIMTSLAMRMGSLNAVADFFQALSPMKSQRLSTLAKVHENLDEILAEMTANQLIKRSFWGYSLTDAGHELEEFMARNEKELSAELRKTIRQFKAKPSKSYSVRYSHLRSKERQFANRRKVLTPNDPASWSGEIAIPETVINAAKRSYVTKKPLKITHQDIQVYARKSYAPVDTCLLVDCSGSMMGERIKSVGFVAEYLLLNSREKVSMVTFQEESAKVAVPWTRSFDDLRDGLSKIHPSGLTPLAHGINTALEMFKKTRPRNPLLVLITDGIPNFALWSTNPLNDAIKAASMIAENKIRFVCIGIDPNHKFLPQLAEAGNGNVYIVDENDRNNMIDIISNERKQYQSGHKGQLAVSS